jgi:hypothetical protein
MKHFELRLDPLDVQAIAEDALRQDYIDQLIEDNVRLSHQLDTARDQRNWAWLIALIACGAHVARFVWAAVMQ